MGHVLVIQIARMGDLTQSLYLIRDLREGDGHRVSVLVDARLEPFVRAMAPWVDEVHGLDVERYLRGFREGGAWTDLYTALASELATPAGRSFDRLVNLNFGALGGAVARAVRGEAPVAGFLPGAGGRCGDAWSELVTHLIRASRRRNRLHLVDNFRFHARRRTRMPRARARPPLGPESVLGVQVATRAAKRTWPAEAFVALLRDLCREPAPRVVLLGDGGERERAEHILRRVGSPRITSRVGETTLGELLEVLRGCDVLLSCDTGTLHVASWLGVPSVALYFGPASPFETGPYGAGHTVVHLPRPCAPCAEGAPCVDGTGSCDPCVPPGLVARLLRGEAPLPEGPARVLAPACVGGWLQAMPTHRCQADTDDVVGLLTWGSLGDLAGRPTGEGPAVQDAVELVRTCYRLPDRLGPLPSDAVPAGLGPEQGARLRDLLETGWETLTEKMESHARSESCRAGAVPARGSPPG